MFYYNKLCILGFTQSFHKVRIQLRDFLMHMHTQPPRKQMVGGDAVPKIKKPCLFRSLPDKNTDVLNPFLVGNHLKIGSGFNPFTTANL